MKNLVTMCDYELYGEGKYLYRDFYDKYLGLIGIKMDYDDLDKLLLSVNYNSTDSILQSNKIIQNSIKDTEKQCYQAMEGIIHNLNTLNSRAGAQTPFSSINLGTDTSNAGRMVTKNLLLALEAGLGNGETSIFPIVIFKVKEGVNYFPEDPNYDLLQLSYRVTAKRLFPNYVFLDSSFNLQYYKPGHPETEVATINNPVAVYSNIC